MKRLRSTPIVRHDTDWDMVYIPHAPYEVLRTGTMDFATLQKLRRFASYWDLVGNSGNFVETTPLLWSAGQASRLSPSDSEMNETGATPGLRSPFHAFLRWSEWLHNRTRRTDSIALVRLKEFLLDYLTRELHFTPRQVAETLWRDYQRGGRTDKPAFLRKFLTKAEPAFPRQRTASLKRQARHLPVEQQGLGITFEFTADGNREPPRLIGISRPETCTDSSATNAMGF